MNAIGPSACASNDLLSSDLVAHIFALEFPRKDQQPLLSKKEKCQRLYKNESKLLSQIQDEKVDDIKLMYQENPLLAEITPLIGNGRDLAWLQRVLRERSFLKPLPYHATDTTPGTDWKEFHWDLVKKSKQRFDSIRNQPPFESAATRLLSPRVEPSQAESPNSHEYHLWENLTRHLPLKESDRKVVDAFARNTMTWPELAQSLGTEKKKQIEILFEYFWHLALDEGVVLVPFSEKLALLQKLLSVQDQLSEETWNRFLLAVTLWFHKVNKAFPTPFFQIDFLPQVCSPESKQWYLTHSTNEGKTLFPSAQKELLTLISACQQQSSSSKSSKECPAWELLKKSSKKSQLSLEDLKSEYAKNTEIPLGVLLQAMLLQLKDKAPWLPFAFRGILGVEVNPETHEIEIPREDKQVFFEGPEGTRLQVYEIHLRYPDGEGHTNVLLLEPERKVAELFEPHMTRVKMKPSELHNLWTKIAIALSIDPTTYSFVGPRESFGSPWSQCRDLECARSRQFCWQTKLPFCYYYALLYVFLRVTCQRPKYETLKLFSDLSPKKRSKILVGLHVFIKEALKNVRTKYGNLKNFVKYIYQSRTASTRPSLKRKLQEGQFSDVRRILQHDCNQVVGFGGRDCWKLRLPQAKIKIPGCKAVCDRAEKDQDFVARCQTSEIGDLLADMSRCLGSDQSSTKSEPAIMLRFRFKPLLPMFYCTKILLRLGSAIFARGDHKGWTILPEVSQVYELAQKHKLSFKVLGTTDERIVTILCLSLALRHKVSGINLSAICYFGQKWDENQQQNMTKFFRDGNKAEFVPRDLLKTTVFKGLFPMHMNATRFEPCVVQIF